MKTRQSITEDVQIIAYIKGFCVFTPLLSKLIFDIFALNCLHPQRKCLVILEANMHFW